MLLTSGLLDVNLTLPLQIVIFLVTVFLLWKIAWGPITKIVVQRQEKIEAGIKAAEESELRLKQVQAEVEVALEEARVNARELLMRAHQEASADGDEARGKARLEAEAIVEKARADIGIERDRAVADLREHVATLVVEATQRILKNAIDPQAHQRLIDESVQALAGEQ